MDLQTIERQVLSLIEYDRYSDISVSSDAEKQADFELLHDCVLLAREEIKIGTYMPQLLKHTASITPSTTQASNTIAETDFDVPVMVYYTDSSGTQYDLEGISSQNILDKVTTLTSKGDPNYYRIFGATAAGLSKIELFPIPEKAGTLVIDYKPVLTRLTTATDEDIIMKKYPQTVINLATAYAARMLKRNQEMFDKYLQYGRAYFSTIDIRENSFSNNTTPQVESLLRQRRLGRYTT